MALQRFTTYNFGVFGEHGCGKTAYIRRLSAELNGWSYFKMPRGGREKRPATLTNNQYWGGSVGLWEFGPREIEDLKKSGFFEGYLHGVIWMSSRTFPFTPSFWKPDFFPGGREVLKRLPQVYIQPRTRSAPPLPGDWISLKEEVARLPPSLLRGDDKNVFQVSAVTGLNCRRSLESLLDQIGK